MKPLIVGEINPYGSDPAFALYPLPEGASGDRLCKILGLSHGEYLRTFDRMNLCTGKWSIVAARFASFDVRDQRRSVVILLGRKVADAFAFGWTNLFTKHRGAFGWYILLPHPSGRCQIWNDSGNVERARQLVGEALRCLEER